MTNDGHILIIEDDADLRALMEESLGAAGHRVLTASDGKEGLASIRRSRPSVVILDLGLPSLDGSRLLQTLRSSHGLADVPVIIVTAGLRTMNRQAAAHFASALNVQQMFTKPVEPGRLLAAVERFARRHEAAPALP